MRWRFTGHAEDEDLAWPISLPNLEVFEGRASWQWVVRFPVDAAAIYPDTEIRLEVVCGDSPVLGQLWKAITPMLGAGDRDFGGSSLIGCTEGNGIAISGSQHCPWLR